MKWTFPDKSILMKKAPIHFLGNHFITIIDSVTVRPNQSSVKWLETHSVVCMWSPDVTPSHVVMRAEFTEDNRIQEVRKCLGSNR